MKQFTSVGKALLIQAVGIQENYTEELSTDIDPVKSGCDNCPTSFLSDKKACETCASKCYQIKKVYRNEKNRFGSKPRLKANALKILLALHFMRPDVNGIVKNVGIKEMSSLIGCDERTVANNFKLLDSYGYIKYTHTYLGKRNVLLLDYKSYFKSAKEGGKGYVVLNKEFFDKFLQIDNLITLRILLRNMVEIDSLNREGSSSINVISKTYDKLRKELPSYCKKGVIKRALDKTDDIFLIKQDEENQTVRFILKDAFIGKKSRREVIVSLSRRIKDFLNNFNDSLLSLESNALPADHPLLPLFSRIKKPGVFLISEKDIYNIAELAEYYSYDLIEVSLLTAYEHYLMPSGKIDSYGALIRSLAKKMYVSGMMAA